MKAHVEDAEPGARPSSAGALRWARGPWFQPTLLDHCNESMSVVREETFGPVLAVVRVEGPAEAIRAANQLQLRAGGLDLDHAICTVASASPSGSTTAW